MVAALLTAAGTGTRMGLAIPKQFIHVDDKPLIEKCNGTIAANGRVMSWRRINNGKNCWLNICDQVKIYARSEEWAVTNKGYVRMKYLEVWYGD